MHLPWGKETNTGNQTRSKLEEEKKTSKQYTDLFPLIIIIILFIISFLFVEQKATNLHFYSEASSTALLTI